MTILVFPSCLEAGVRFADEAHHWRQRVIGPSSLDTDPYASHYDAWEKLPFIGDDSFFGALSSLVERQKVDSIFTPHAPSFNLLEAELPSRLPHVSIIGAGPFKTQVNRVEEALAKAKHDLGTVGDFGIVSKPLPVQFVAGLLLQLDHFFGQCSREKALAACAVMPSAVE